MPSTCVTLQSTFLIPKQHVSSVPSLWVLHSQCVFLPETQRHGKAFIFIPQQRGDSALKNRTAVNCPNCIAVSASKTQNSTDRTSTKSRDVLTYLLTPWCRVLPEQLPGLQLVKKFPAFHGTQRFITALTSVHHLSLSWASPIQSTCTHPTSWRSILILSTHLCLGLPSGLLPSGFPTKTLYTPLCSPIRATCPAHLILLNFITHTILGEEGERRINYVANIMALPLAAQIIMQA